MPQTIRISTPGNNAGTDTDLDHYALYADEDNVLIKEYSRGEIDRGYGESGTISHDLGYFPFALAWGENNNGNYDLCLPRSAFEAYGFWYLKLYNNKIVIDQLMGFGTKTCKYYIFYDQLA